MKQSTFTHRQTALGGAEAIIQNTPHGWKINGQTVTVLHPCDAHDGAFIVRMADDSIGCLYGSELAVIEVSA